jgi:preprotein translocase subunit SecG
MKRKRKSVQDSSFPHADTPIRPLKPLYNAPTLRHIPPLMWLSFLIPVLEVILVVSCFLLIFVVLMQRPKNEGLGAAFGSGVTENIFGAQTTTVLTKATLYLGGVFFIITFILTTLTARQSVTGRTGLLEAEARKAVPVASPSVSGSASPAVSAAPGASATPAASAAPSASPEASASATPAASASASGSPETSASPAPEASASPSVAASASSAPKTTASPAASPKAPQPSPHR